MDEFIEPRYASRGRAYVYVLPWRDEDLLKIGFSREPLQRFRSLHRRFYTCFDLERGLLLEAERVSQARRIERRLLTACAEHRAMPPLSVREAAAGYTEWYRGVDAQAGELARRLADEAGLRVHAPLRAWLAATLSERADLLYDWSLRMLDGAQLERTQLDDAGPLEQALLDTLALCEAVGLPLQHWLPEVVLAWHRDGPHRRLFQH